VYIISGYNVTQNYYFTASPVQCTPVFLGCTAAIASEGGLLLHTDQRGQSGSICLSVCLLVTFVSPAKTAEPIVMDVIFDCCLC